MRYSRDWKDYAVLNAGNKRKWEQYGSYTLSRPDPVATWKPTQPLPQVDAAFQDTWKLYRDVPDAWTIHYKDLQFLIKPTQFKHTGIFPEQAVNWDWMRSVLQSTTQECRILNLFGYTGGASIACAKEDNVVELVHIDALKKLNEWTQENVRLNELEDKTIRTITEDVLKFLAREKKRGRTYHGIIMDPPSYGKGPKGQVWKIEQQLQGLLDAAFDVLDPEALFVVLNTYTTNLPEKTVQEALESTARKHGFEGFAHTEGIGLPIASHNKILPCGITTRWCYREDLL